MPALVILTALDRRAVVASLGGQAVAYLDKASMAGDLAQALRSLVRAA